MPLFSPCSGWHCHVHFQSTKLTGTRWAYLQAGIARIMHDLEQGIDMQMYMGVYTCVLLLR